MKMLKTTGKKDNKGQEIFENDVLYNPISGYKYTVKYGEFVINYTKPFHIKCLGFYIEYMEDNTKQIDSFLMLNLNNVEKV